MFSIDTKITDLKLKEKSLAKLLFSMNNHQVATPDMSAEEAKSYVFILREGNKYLCYVCLYFLRSDRRMYYSYDKNPFTDNELPDVEEEARGFAEDLGAMLDELDLVHLSDIEKDRWIDEQNMFSGKKMSQETSGDTLAKAGVDQSRPAEHTTPVAAPEPSAKPAAAPAEPSKPAETVTPAPSAPAPQPVPAVQPAAAAAPAERPQIQTPAPPPVTPRPQKRQADSTRQASDQPKTVAPTPASERPAEEVLTRAVNEDRVPATKQPLKKDVPSSAGAVKRNKEALARLLASF
jgi:hypothetical protein